MRPANRQRPSVDAPLRHAEGAVTLDPVSYWRLRALSRDADYLVAQAQVVIQQAASVRDAYLSSVADRYHFAMPTPTTSWRWNDETCQIITGV